MTNNHNSNVNDHNIHKTTAPSNNTNRASTSCPPPRPRGRSRKKDKQYVHTCIHTYITLHTCIHYIHTYIHTLHTYIHTYIRAYIHTYIQTYIHACIHTYMYVYLYVCAESGPAAPTPGTPPSRARRDHSWHKYVKHFQTIAVSIVRKLKRYTLDDEDYQISKVLSSRTASPHTRTHCTHACHPRAHDK